MIMWEKEYSGEVNQVQVIDGVIGHLVVFAGPGRVVNGSTGSVIISFGFLLCALCLIMKCYSLHSSYPKNFQVWFSHLVKG